MAAGDIVSGITIYSGGAFLTFQAAAGVEVAITHVTSHSGWLGLYDGTTQCRFSEEGYATGGVNGVQNTPMKLMVNNSIYLRSSLNSSSSNNGFCGIQIK
jgi:hypothetical protein